MLCAYTRLSFTISHCHTHTHTDSSRLTGENIHCQCEKWSGTDGIRMIETTYNGSHNFPVSLSLSPSLVDRFLPLYLPAPAFSPSYTQAFSMSVSQLLPKRLRLNGSPTAPHKVSQEEKERRENGREEEAWRGGGRRGSAVLFLHLFEIPPPPVLFSAPLFLDHCTACNNLKSRNIRSHARDLLLLKQLK